MYYIWDMKMAERIRIAMVKRGNIREAELARRLGKMRQSLSQQMKRDNFAVNDLEKIAEVLDCRLKVTLIMKDTGEEI
jgi:IS30 family transposase